MTPWTKKKLLTRRGPAGQPDALATTAALPAIGWGFFDMLDQAPIAEVRTKRTAPYKIWLFAQLPLAAGVAGTGIAVGNLARGGCARSGRFIAVAGVRDGRAVLRRARHRAHRVRKAGAGRGGWLVVARKIPMIAAALLLGAPGAGLSTVAVAGVLAGAAGAQILWDIWERAHAGARNGEDPGPGLARAHRPA